MSGNLNRSRFLNTLLDTVACFCATRVCVLENGLSMLCGVEDLEKDLIGSGERSHAISDLELK